MGTALGLRLLLLLFVLLLLLVLQAPQGSHQPGLNRGGWELGGQG